MPTTRRLAALAAAVLLALGAVPAGALAQGAGDEQYQDPFAGGGSGSGSGSSTTPSSGASGSGTQSAPAASGSPAAPAPATAAPAGAAPASAELPRTGLDLRLVAGAGALLLLAGLLLRRLTADGRS